ncbi:MAG: hypothetical protein IKT74_05575, partial [Bacteroidales bacterium]|nr:hypothetical protein [Bacteroidales bacterium]
MSDNKKKKEMNIHKTSYLMYEKTKKECIERMSEAMNEDVSKRWTQEDINEKKYNIVKNYDACF